MYLKNFSKKTKFLLLLLIVLIVGAGWCWYKRAPKEENLIPQLPAQEITVEGEFTCLPHKDTSGPQTLECAYGLKSTDGKFYGLFDPDTDYANIQSVPMGEKIILKGFFTPTESELYLIEGSIEIHSVERVK